MHIAIVTYLNIVWILVSFYHRIVSAKCYVVGVYMGVNVERLCSHQLSCKVGRNKSYDYIRDILECTNELYGSN